MATLLGRRLFILVFGINLLLLLSSPTAEAEGEEGMEEGEIPNIYFFNRKKQKNLFSNKN